jgi:glycerophosphoryl diester phosphodiesterase
MIAHRGASFHLPEHTLPAYRLAWELQADYLEPDLVVSSDGVLFVLHDVDLSVTTNVIDVYGDQDRQWYSPIQKRNGYWSFNFTAAELSRLTVRQRLPTHRSTIYDNVFPVPTLRGVAQQLVEWNSNDGGILGSSPAGLYVEMKDSDWIRTETGWDVVELLYREIIRLDDAAAKEDDGDDTNPWPTLLTQGHNQVDCVERGNVVPGLIVQSFNAEDLQRFHDLWWQVTLPPPEPPYVLLVDYPTCTFDQFWFHVGQSYRGIVSAIGMQLECLNDYAVLERLRQYNLPSHAWTVRPEDVVGINATTSSSLSLLQNQMDYLMCNPSGVVNAIFTETPAIRPTYRTYADCPSAQRTVRCIPPSNEILHHPFASNSTSSMVVAMVVAFVVGAGMAALSSWFLWRQKQKQDRSSFLRSNKRQRHGHDAVPTSDQQLHHHEPSGGAIIMADDSSHSVELT